MNAIELKKISDAVNKRIEAEKRKSAFQKKMEHIESMCLSCAERGECQWESTIDNEEYNEMKQYFAEKGFKVMYLKTDYQTMTGFQISW